MASWPNRYFLICYFLQRCQNRCLMLLCFRDGGEDKGVSHGDRSIQTFARWLPLMQFFLYIIYLMLYIKCDQTGSVAGIYACSVQDLGSNPRSAQFQYYFAISVHMQRYYGCTPCILNGQAYTRPKRSRQRQGFKERINPGQMHHTWLGKSMRFQASGPEFLSLYLLNWGYPPWFAFFYFSPYILFLLFHLFSLF